MIKVLTDGSAKHISGGAYVGVYGFSIYEDGFVRYDQSGFLGLVPEGASESEIQGALKALKYVYENYQKNYVKIKTDNSQAKEVIEGMLPLDRFVGKVEVEKVSREEVERADRLCWLEWYREDLNKQLKALINSEGVSQIPQESKLHVKDFPMKRNSVPRYAYKMMPIET